MAKPPGPDQERTVHVIGREVPAQDSPRAIPPLQGGLIGRLQRIVESRRTEKAIITLIILNAITLALETSPTVMAAAGELLLVLDQIFLLIFTAEILTKVVVYRTRIGRDPWNIFDAAVVAIAWIPATGGLSVLRALRILRVLRLISAVPSMRRVVTALMRAIPGMGSIVALLGLVYFVFSVMATKLYGASFPDWFGTIGGSAYSLFQIMTLESWSMGIVRPVMEQYPLAWVFFVPFILMTSFTVLNLFIGIIVDAMQSQHQPEPPDEAEVARTAESRRRAEALPPAILAEIQALRREVAELRRERGG